MQPNCLFRVPAGASVSPRITKQEKAGMLELREYDLLPQGAEANLDQLTSALNGDYSWTGFFNAPRMRMESCEEPHWFSRMVAPRIRRMDIYPSLIS